MQPSDVSMRAVDYNTKNAKYIGPAHANEGRSKPTRFRKGFSYTSELGQSGDIKQYVRWLGTFCRALRGVVTEAAARAVAKEGLNGFMLAADLPSSL
eukprot:6192479-Pleurochrysis_carterae.AAC.1